jgi:hypothetical protein
MTTITIPDKYVETLRTLGNIDAAVSLAVQRYTIEQITTKINTLRQKADHYQARYGMDYPAFYERLADEEFVTQLEADGYTTWEIDQADWEFCHEGIQDWTATLQRILLS